MRASRPTFIGIRNSELDLYFSLESEKKTELWLREAGAAVAGSDEATLS